MRENICPTAFLASPRNNLENLRYRIYELRRNIWVAEFSEPNINDSDDVNRICLERIRQADTFIFIANKDYGTYEAFDFRAREYVSLLEIEVFQSIIANKHVFIFKLKDYEFNKKLKSILSIFESYKRVTSFQCYNEEDVVKFVDKKLGLTSRILRKFTKNQNKIPTSVADSYFLNNEFDKYCSQANYQETEKILLESKKYDNNALKLAILWIAIRKLCNVPFTSDNNLEYLPLWDKALTAWSKASAWHGLHHVPIISQISAINSLILVRQKLSSYNREEVRIPHGPLSSALYSLAKHVARPEKKIILHRALKEVNLALQNTSQEISRSNVLAIRGSIFLALKQFKEAIYDYETVVEIRKGSNKGGIGEALSELGWGYIRQRKRQRGLDCLRRGVRYLQDSKRITFYARSLKKLALAELLNGNIFLASEAAQKLTVLIDKYSIYDQSSRTMRILSKLGSIGNEQ